MRIDWQGEMVKKSKLLRKKRDHIISITNAILFHYGICPSRNKECVRVLFIASAKSVSIVNDRQHTLY